MAAENELVDLLQKEARTLLENGTDTNADLTGALEKWGTEYVNMPQKPLDIEGEVKMSLQQSYQIYRSIPEHALAIQRVAEKVFGLAPETELTITDGGNENTLSLREWVVDAASKAIRNETWSPGDVDSKPHMRPAEMEKGILMGRVAIRQQYIHDLAKIGAHPQLDPESEGYQKIQAMVWRLFNDVDELYQSRQDKDGKYIINRIIESLGEENSAARQFLETVQKPHNALKAARKSNRMEYKSHLLNTHRHKNKEIDDDTFKLRENNFFNNSASYLAELDAPFRKHILNIGSSFIKADPFDKGYEADITKLKREMKALVDDKDIQKVNYQDIAGNLDSEKSTLRAIDALQMQVNSYGLQAQRITHRQSSEAYAAGIAEIHGVILLGKDLPEISETYTAGARELTALYDELKIERDKSEKDDAQIATLKEEIHEKSVPLTQELITFLNTDERKEDADKIRTHIQKCTSERMKFIRDNL
jgi:phosphoenolpyruvate carboxylase